MEATMGSKKRATALKFATLYRDCVESFGLIHQGKKDWDRPQHLLLVKIGIQQAKLLAWSQIIGVCELGECRDPRLDDTHLFEQIDIIIKGMLDRLIHVDHGIQLATYGLKPSKKANESLEPALDSTRLESFREQYMLLPESIYASWSKATHWAISDNGKFSTLIADTHASVDRLVQLMGIESRVDQCLKQDIKAMGWHPVFDRTRAASDGSKLRLIKDSCHDEYPIYAAATELPLSYLNTQWTDSYQESMMLRYPASNPYRSQLDKFTRAEGKDGKKSIAADTSAQKPSLSGMFSKLRSHSWHKRHSGPAINIDPPRANSALHATREDDLEETLTPERSKSEGAIANATHNSPNVLFAHPFSIDKTIVPSETSIEKEEFPDKAS
jgi:hypothetical protein